MLLAILAGLLQADVPKSHVELVERGEHPYVVVHGGTVDGRSFRSPMGVYEGWTQGWESNGELRMSNEGDSDVVNPWISNGRNDFRTVKEILASAVKPGMSDREKALAIYAQEIRHRWHWGGDNDDLGDVVKVFNVYGHNTCGNDSMCLAALWTRAGLKVRGACLVGHCVSEVFFDGRWNLMDGDGQGLYLLRDGRTIASELDLARDHDLVKRTHTLGPLRRAERRGDEWQAALYVMEGGERYPRDGYVKHTMDLTLRPGEALVWRWARSAKPKTRGAPGIRFPATVCNGLWEYRPRLPAGGLAGSAEWEMKSPYVFVGGKLEAEGADASFEISLDGKTWTKTGPDLDARFSSGKPCYAYRLRCSLPEGARLGSLRILNDVQMAPLAMPEMVLGENRFVYSDRSSGPRKVRITHAWTERSSMRPPAPPAAALSPRDGGSSAGTAITFAWEPSKDPDGDRIADYHFELSDRADFAYPLSSNFNRLISKVAPRLAERFALPRAGLLSPGRTYYWRIRAQDAKGVWGPWSPAWSFKAGGPAVPLDVEVGGDGVLRWRSNPEGSRPATYRVYGSDEKGFSVSDEPYEVLGAGKEAFAANFVADCPKPELAVLGPGRSNRAFYRVVAVDAAGERSADSDFAESPRPFVHMSPPPAARVGRAFTHAVATIRSMGDVRARDGSKLEMRFWDVERPRFAIEEGPAWLKIDPATGALSGTPDAPGRVNAKISATLELEERKIDPRALSWGQDKSLGTSMKSFGKAFREFAIEVAP